MVTKYSTSGWTKPELLKSVWILVLGYKQAGSGCNPDNTGYFYSSIDYMYIDPIPHCELKGDFRPPVFHYSNPSEPLINRLKYFRIRFRFRRDIQ